MRVFYCWRTFHSLFLLDFSLALVLWPAFFVLSYTPVMRNAVLLMDDETSVRNVQKRLFSIHMVKLKVLILS